MHGNARTYPFCPKYIIVLRVLLASLGAAVVFVLLGGATWNSGVQSLLPAEEAFVIRAQLQSGPSAPVLHLDFDIAPGYYLYRNKIAFVGDATVYGMDEPVLLEGVSIVDKFFGDTVVYQKPWSVNIPLEIRGALEDVRTVEVAIQGCATKPAVCYPPERRVIPIAPLSAEDASIPLIVAATPSEEEAPLYTNQNALLAYFQDNSGWLVLPLFWFFGVLLSLTPCVLPMVPILGGLLVRNRSARGPSVAFSYVLGMSFAYSTAGIAAALLGSSLQGFLQQPAVLLTAALLLVVMAFSMFDFLHVQMPVSWNNRVNRWQQQLAGGSLFRVFALGALSAWVISPCVTPPLVGALIYIADSGDVVLGGSALAALGFGMGLPLLLLGFSAHWLPRGGPWMVYLKRALGVLLLLVAVLLVERTTAVLDRGAESAVTPQTHTRLLFEPVDGWAHLERILAESNGLVMHKLYADWCSSCLEMERTTFRDKRVQLMLSGISPSTHKVRLLVSDVTANTALDRALMKRFQLFGPPVLMFFRDGVEIVNARMVGYVSPEQLLRRLSSLAP